jgi:RNA recognition motif-containing protein
MEPPSHRDTTIQEGSMHIFVGNLNWETREDELEQLFAPYGGELER